MKKHWLNSRLQLGLVTLMLLLAGTGSAAAQEFTVAMFHPETVESTPPVRTVQPELPMERPVHGFWDRENKILFSAVAASAGADFAVTHANLANGGKELNPITRLFAGSTAGLAVNFAGETAGTIGLSYVFHKKGHHKLERLTPMVGVGSSLMAAGYGLAHR